MMMNKIKEFLKSNKRSILKYGGVLTIFLLMIFIAIITQDPPYSPTRYYSPVAISLPFGEIVWYAVFILLGITLAAYLSYDEFKKLGWDTEILFDGLIYAVPLAIVGSRIYDMIFKPENYNSFNDFIGYTPGVGVSLAGLSIHGAVITTIIFLFFFTKKKKINFWIMADILVIGFLVGQISGRWGNFMNAEAYGPAIESEFLLNIIPNFILNQMNIGLNGIYHHPTFLYEGIWNFIGLVFLLIARRKRWFKIGDTFGFYLIWYGLGRGAIIEPLRAQGAIGDAYEGLFGIPANVLMSLIGFMLSGILIIVLRRVWLKDQKYYVDCLVKEA
jgi:phosphatidylglycerol---prolipoprotein diacylglyceryl transferase